jgi:AraC family transcriptional regulator of arabinose operon
MTGSHHHNYYEIYYLLGGERTYFINDRVYMAKKGDMVLINVHDLHRTTSSDVAEFERILIYFTYDFMKSVFLTLDCSIDPFAGGSRLLHFDIAEQRLIEELLLEMLQECREKPEAYEAYLRASLLKLMIKTQRVALKESEEPLVPTHPMHQKISEIASYVNAHFHEKVTLDRLATQFYISPSYLSRIFKKVTGYYFQEYLQVIRVREAQRLLRESDDKVTFIAGKVGFGHIAHFNRTFKHITRYSPLKYRKMNQK